MASKRSDSPPAATPRRYHSPVRQQQSRETRQRIIDAGAELVHGFVDWDWTNLNARAVGSRAGVSERTVQRYFPTERQLRDAVLQRLVEESGIDLTRLELDNFAAVTARLYGFLASFSTTARGTDEPALADIDNVRRQALLDAVGRATPDWKDSDREAAAAVLDILWNRQPYERLTRVWELTPERATESITWLIELINEAIRDGRGPTFREQ